MLKGRDIVGVIAGLAVCLGALGCVGTQSGPRPDERDTLARIGLVCITEEEAHIPPEDRGKFVPCRVRPDCLQSPVPPHPAGYLIVGINKERGAGAAQLRRQLAAWKPGETLVLGIQRNPYLQDVPAWYEIEVKVRQPEH